MVDPRHRSVSELQSSCRKLTEERGVFPRATGTDTFSHRIVTGRGVADAQGLGFGDATVGCLRYNLVCGKVDH